MTETDRPARVLHLRIRVAPGKRDALFEFLKEAVPYYEAPGGIRVRLIERSDAPDSFIEVVEYDSVESFDADQQRVDHDPRMRELLARWRALLAEPPAVEVYHEALERGAP
jgi:quinol monooxygenase YgiN